MTAGAARWADLFRAIRIDSPLDLTLGGRKFSVPPAPVPPPPGPLGGSAPSQAPLLALLNNVLYHHGYSRSFDGQLAPPGSAAAEPFTPDAELMASLAAANGTRDRWEHG